MSDTYIQGMTDEQSLAVMSERRLVIVRAGAGTGKTRVMISRAARLCNSGRRVLMTTFTRAAREEMQERMSKMMKKGCGVGIMTLGSLAWRLAGKPELLSESERRSMMLGIIPRQAVDVDHEFDAHMKGESTAAEKLIERVSDVLKIIDRLHANGIYGDTINDDDRAEINNPEICRILEDWDALCSNRQVYDATTIFRKATDAIGNASEDLRQWDDILVDEAQDLSYVQYEMIRSLCGRDGRCFMVGDPDQSIYAFRSAIPGFMSTDYIIALRGPHDREDISLTRNYRCTKPVLDAAVNCVNSLFRQDRKVLVSDRPGKRPRILRKPGEAKEGKLIADRIGELIASGVNPGEIAVIARAHYALNETITHLAHNRIPYIQVGRSFMSRPEVVLITSMFRLLSNANDFSAAKELLGFLYPGKKDMDAVVQLHPEMSAFAAMCEAGGRGAKAREMTARLKSLAALYGDGASAIHILESFIRDTDLHERMKKNKEAGSISHSLSDLRRMAIDAVSVQNMNEGLQERMIVSDGGKTEDGHVFVGTIFASKGLEFEHVFIPGMFNGCFPSKKSMSGMGDGNIDFRYNLHHFGSIDEEKRLLYVAMTRARQELTMTYPDHTGRGKMARKVTPSTLLLSTGIMMP